MAIVQVAYEVPDDVYGGLKTGALKPMSAIVLTLIGTSMPIIVGCTWKIPF